MKAKLINQDSSNQAYQKAMGKWKKIQMVKIPGPTQADLQLLKVYERMDKVSHQMNQAKSLATMEMLDREFSYLWDSVAHTDAEECPAPMKPRVEKRDQNVVFVNFKR